MGLDGSHCNQKIVPLQSSEKYSQGKPVGALDMSDLPSACVTQMAH